MKKTRIEPLAKTLALSILNSVSEAEATFLKVMAHASSLCNANPNAEPEPTP
eukprot:SAG11_NODE_7119_length_1190_cov_1.326306_2_plen_52_part_00